MQLQTSRNSVSQLAISGELWVMGSSHAPGYDSDEVQSGWTCRGERAGLRWRTQLKRSRAAASQLAARAATGSTVHWVRHCGNRALPQAYEPTETRCNKPLCETHRPCARVLGSGTLKAVLSAVEPSASRCDWLYVCDQMRRAKTHLKLLPRRPPGLSLFQNLHLSRRYHGLLRYPDHPVLRDSRYMSPTRRPHFATEKRTTVSYPVRPVFLAIPAAIRVV